MAIGGYPAAGALLVLAEFRVGQSRVAPGELPFADEEEGVGEVVEQDGELLRGQEQFVSREAARADLDGRDSLAVLEAEDAGKVFLREFVLLAQRLDALADW